ncbi:MAG: flavodoxin family protein [Gordonia sp. (in: high G+C Gram-positive bacteria)]|uniref:flavodoxin family protein n=1 Tax=Gordonia sp. (in: high G+C Gram-positive bacteria) TaxID=84139 RepID=UPI0039E42099
MKALLVCSSVAHGNTRRVADEMAAELGCLVVEPAQIAAPGLDGYDLVGFGSGVYDFAFHPDLNALVDSLPVAERGRAFVFGTSGTPEPPFARYTRRFADRLAAKGYDVAGTFLCRGLDTWGPFKLVGGIGRARPNDDDLAAARAFAAGLR